jgi:hypothetical protein
MVLLHRSYPSAPHLIAAVLSAMHSHGAVQGGGASPAAVCWVSAIIPIEALTVPHISAIIPRITRILTYRFHIIPDHHCLTIPGRRPVILSR